MLLSLDSQVFPSYIIRERAGQAEGEEGGAEGTESRGIIQYLLFVMFCQNEYQVPCLRSPTTSTKSFTTGNVTEFHCSAVELQHFGME